MVNDEFAIDGILIMFDPLKVWPSPRLIRAARGLAGINQVKLAEKIGVARKTIALIEADESDRMDPRRLKILQSLQRFFEDNYGIEFFEGSENSGEGVRLRKVEEKD
jgi:DNA-binding XRE family transcriptional regulator